LISIKEAPSALVDNGAAAEESCMAATPVTETYNDKVVYQFSVMTVVWGIVGMLVGVLIAAQLYWPALNFDTAWLSFGRLRPLHTNAVIFAFGGCALMATSLHVVQRTCHATLFGGNSCPSCSGAGSWSSCWPRSPCPWA
jgi:cytochrome c oxidase cbb3-type subunit 1